MSNLFRFNRKRNYKSNESPLLIRKTSNKTLSSYRDKNQNSTNQLESWKLRISHKRKSTVTSHMLSTPRLLKFSNFLKFKDKMRTNKISPTDIPNPPPIYLTLLRKITNPDNYLKKLRRLDKLRKIIDHKFFYKLTKSNPNRTLLIYRS